MKRIIFFICILATRLITVFADASYTAIFARSTASITVSSSNCDTVQRYTYNIGDTIVIQANATDSCHHFESWADGNTENPRSVIVSGDASYMAIFALNEYTVNDAIYACGDEVTLFAPDSVCYSFVQWSNGVKANPGTVVITQDSVITPIYKQNVYQVLWTDADGIILEIDSVYCGSIPDYNGLAPQKAASAQYVYTFSGWTPSVTVVSGDEVYTATYNANLRSYTITFLNEDGTELQSSEVSYGSMPQYLGTPPVKTANAQYTYSFHGWNHPISSVTGAASYVAVFDSVVNQYTVTYKNSDGSLLQQSVMTYGSIPQYAGTTPQKQGNAQYSYTFSGWTPSEDIVTGNVTYVATYTETVNTYIITFANDDGAVLQSDTIEYGQMPQYNGTAPTKDSTAQYSYTFSGWSPFVAVVTSNAVYTATFAAELRSYTITFLNEDGTVLQSSEVAYGELPQYNGSTPLKNEDAAYTYTFSGWTPVLVSVSGEATYTATYVATLRSFMLTVDGHNGSTTGSGIYTYGTDVTINAIPDADYHFVSWSDGNLDNPRVVTVITDSVFTAVFAPDCEEWADWQVIEKYGWLLMLDQKAAHALGYTFTEENVTWYRVVENPDAISVTGIVDDEPVGNGYYLTLDKPLTGTGDYYAVVDVSASSNTLCNDLMCTVIVPYSGLDKSKQHIEMIPTVAHVGEEVQLLGLNPDEKTVIRVYDTTGKLLEEHISKDTSTFFLGVQQVVGCYFVQVQTSVANETFRYMVNK